MFDNLTPEQLELLNKIPKINLGQSSIQQRFDTVLYILNKDGYQKKTVDDIFNEGLESPYFGKKANTKTAPILSGDEVEPILLMLENDGYVYKNGNGYLISPEGKLFFNEGGYISKKARKRRKKAWYYIKIGGAIFQALIIIYLSYQNYLVSSKNSDLAKDNLEQSKAIFELSKQSNKTKELINSTQANDAEKEKLILQMGQIILLKDSTIKKLEKKLKNRK